jgi:hypothetical protein
VSIQRNSTSPVAAGLQEHFDRYRSFSQILSDVCQDKKVHVLGDTPEGLVAFVYRPKEDSPSQYLVAHNTLNKAGGLAIPLSTIRSDGKSPVAVKDVSAKCQGARYLSEDDTHITIDRSSDTTSSVLVVEIAQLVTLPGKDDSSSIMIAASNATSQAIAEKAHQIEEHAPAAENIIKQNQDVDNYLANASVGTGTLEEAAKLTDHPTPSISELPELVADDGDSIDSGSGAESPISQPIKPASFLSWLKRFFVGFWSWLFAPFGLGRVGDNADEDQAGSGTITPNERTHLLSVS